MHHNSTSIDMVLSFILLTRQITFYIFYLTAYISYGIVYKHLE